MDDLYTTMWVAITSASGDTVFEISVADERNELMEMVSWFNSKETFADRGFDGTAEVFESSGDLLLFFQKRTGVNMTALRDVSSCVEDAYLTTCQDMIEYLGSLERQVNGIMPDKMGDFT